MITSRGEFSWYNEGFFPKDPLDWLDFTYALYEDDPVELRALAKSIDLARKHLAGEIYLNISALYYMTPAGFDHIKPSVTSHSPLVALGDHLFIDTIRWR